MNDCNNPDCVNGWLFDPDTDTAKDRCRTCDPVYKSPEERERIRREEREVKDRRAERRRRAELEQAEVEQPRRPLPYNDD